MVMGKCTGHRVVFLKEVGNMIGKMEKEKYLMEIKV